MSKEQRLFIKKQLLKGFSAILLSTGDINEDIYKKLVKELEKINN